MRSTGDPSRWWRARERGAIVSGAAATACCLAWALAPLDREAPPPPAPAERAASAAREPDPPLDRGAFAAAIWNPPAPPPEQPRTVESAQTGRPHPPPLRLQLLGIARDGAATADERLRAALYDPADGTLRLVGLGERVGPATVSAIDGRSVELTIAGRATRLALHEGGRP